MSIFLGFDTSNYTTSVAGIDNGNIISKRKILEVKKGERGLRQSDALFQHIKNLPDLYRELSKEINLNEVEAVGVSVAPRNCEGSYMPVFLGGMGYAKVVADTLGVPLFEFSHQDGHIMAGILSCGNNELLKRPFLSLHLSGGTTELLKSRYNGHSFENEIIGGTKDISAGQLIDRVGVLLGLSFPCGAELEKLASPTELKFKTSVSGSYLNFSGAETMIMRETGNHENYEIAYATLSHVAEAISKILNNALKENNIKDILIVGGVSSNKLIREYLDKNVDGRIFYASRELSTDNAVGIAALVKERDK